MKRKQTTVTADDWCVGTNSGTNINGCELSLFRGFSPAGKPRYSQYHKKPFDNDCDATRFCLDHGYLEFHYPRPFGFISLRLSPATRRYLLGKSEVQRWDCLAKIFVPKSCDNGKYFNAVRHASYMSSNRNEWNSYMAGNWSIYRDLH